VNTLQQRTWLGYLALVRILVGVQFFMVGWPKLAGGRFLSRNGQPLAEDLLRGAPKDYLAWHRAFITGFVVPHAHFFSETSGPRNSKSVNPGALADRGPSLRDRKPWPRVLQKPCRRASHRVPQE